MSVQCNDLIGDRKLGEEWEVNFGTLAKNYGATFTANQIGRTGAAEAYYLGSDGKRARLILPDFALWTFPGQHHEIKHKDRAKRGPRKECYGLERYRFDSLVEFQGRCKQVVYYTIHDHEKAGGKLVKENRIQDWVTAPVDILDGSWSFSENGDSYCNSGTKTKEILYWHYSLFTPLEYVLSGEPMDLVLKSNPLLAEVERLRSEVVKFRRMANEAASIPRSVSSMRRRQENASLFLQL